MRKRSRSIFSKIALVFTATLCVSFALILLFGTRYLDYRAQTSVESDCILSLKSMEQYVFSKFEISKQAIATLYNSAQFNGIPAYMSSDSENHLATTDFVNTIDSYFQLYCALDNDIICIALDCQKEQKIYAKYRNALNLTDLTQELDATIQNNLDSIPRYGFCMLPTTAHTFSPQRGYYFTMLCNVKRTGMQDTLGHLLIEFSSNPLQTYTTSLPFAQFYILSADGTIVYDQSHQQTGQIYPDFLPESFQNVNREDLGKSELFVSNYNSELGLYFVSTVPLQEVYQSTGRQRAMLYAAVLPLALISLMVTFVFVNQYHHRINQVCDAIRQIQGGNLDTQIQPPKQQDELTLISENLNRMCAMLREYIQKVYVTQIEAQSNEVLRKDAELKQKVAELYALQTQIDPHFMFNTLESIRMRALASGNRDIAQTIYLLSTLFRQNLKEGFVITLAEELHFCRLYLELMLSRYLNNVQVDIDAAEEFCECGIIRHILQPLIENSIQHGLLANTPAACIRISIHRQAEDLYLNIIDNGRGISAENLILLRQQLASQTTPKSSRIGLSNVHQRLVSIFGEPYGLTLESEPNVKTTVTVRVPFMTSKEMEAYVQRFNRG